MITADPRRFREFRVLLPAALAADLERSCDAANERLLAAGEPLIGFSEWVQGLIEIALASLQHEARKAQQN